MLGLAVLGIVGAMLASTVKPEAAAGNGGGEAPEQERETKARRKGGGLILRCWV